MRNRFIAQWVLLLILTGMACSFPESSRSPESSARTISAQAKAPSAAGALAADSGVNPEWAAVVRGAEREGRLALSGPPGESWRRALMSFQEDFPNIRIEYTGGNSRDFWPRLFRERELGQYLWDLRVGGPDPQVYEARDRNVLNPLPPLFLLPEIRDETKWFGGFQGFFLDKERKYIAGFLAYSSPSVFVNRDLVPEADFRSDEDLLNPRWRGKIVLQDPRGGAGLGSMTILLAVHGEPFVRTLLSQQNVAVTDDIRQQAEWVVRGRYPIAIGLNPDQLLTFREQGLKINVHRLKEGSTGLSVGFGGIQRIDRAPHPNAATLFINWLLQQEVQQRLTQVLRTNSRRRDVPPGDTESMLNVNELHRFVPHQYEEFLVLRQRATLLARQLLR